MRREWDREFDTSSNEKENMNTRQVARTACGALLAAIWLVAAPATAQDGTASPASPAAVQTTMTITCSSSLGDRQHCPADTSHGVVLARSSGQSPCLLGRSCGYDDQGVWVSEGCGGEFLTGTVSNRSGRRRDRREEKSPEYIPNAGSGFRGEKGQIYMRLFTYVRYLNQKGLDPTYTDSFGNTHAVQQRQDVQLNKFFLPFSGWFLTPKFRYYLYVWSSNPSQGDPAQVVGAGNLSYTFNRFVTLGGGIGCLPSVRSTEGQFPYWLGVDDRLIADEFFRARTRPGSGSRASSATKLKYMAMLGEQPEHARRQRLAARQQLDTSPSCSQWLPTTGEFGLYGDVRRLRLAREAGHAARPPLHPQPRRQADPAGHRHASRTARSGSPTAA